MQKLFLPMIPELHGGHGLLKNDSVIFHDKAVEIAARIHANGWSEWSLFPKDQLANVGVLAAFYAIFGSEPALFIPLNAAAHATGALMFLFLGPVLWPGRPGRFGGLIAGILFIASPSALAWYSQNHKDAFAISGILMVLYAYLRIKKMGSNQVNLGSMFSLGLAGGSLIGDRQALFSDHCRSFIIRLLGGLHLRYSRSKSFKKRDVSDFEYTSLCGDDRVDWDYYLQAD